MDSISSGVQFDNARRAPKDTRLKKETSCRLVESLIVDHLHDSVHYCLT